VQQRWWDADDAVSRAPAWVAVDVGAALLSAWIAVGDSDTTAGVGSGPLAVRLAAALWFVTIALRRFLPATCLWVAGAATVLAAAGGGPLTNISLASALALGLVFRTRPAAAAALLSAVPASAALGALATDPDGRGTWALAALVHLAAVAWGISSRRSAHGRARLEELSRQRAVDAERARLALDLHDAVGHAVTVMLTCAGAARLALPPGESAARTSLGLVEQAGRSAMQDLDRVLGLLRPEGSGETPLEERLQTLVRTSGLEASLELPSRGTSDPLPAELQEAVYRIVQESLTNVLRHSSGRSVHVVVDRAPEQVRVTVTDGGPAAGAGPPPPAPGGRGLLGMSERVTALGGTLTAGPTGAGWRVDALLPVSPARVA
jgi:signal transduction histidine kinase